MFNIIKYIIINTVISCYQGPKYNIPKWCQYHQGTYINTPRSTTVKDQLSNCKFNNLTLAHKAANDPLNLCIYNWTRCENNSDCNYLTGHIHCVKKGCCSPGYCMISRNGVFSIPNHNNNTVRSSCIKNGGIWNVTQNECDWYEIQCG